MNTETTTSTSVIPKYIYVPDIPAQMTDEQHDKSLKQTNDTNKKPDTIQASSK